MYIPTVVLVIVLVFVIAILMIASYAIGRLFQVKKDLEIADIAFTNILDELNDDLELYDEIWMALREVAFKRRKES